MSKKQQMTKATRLALQFVAEHGPINPRRFAEGHWPEGFERSVSTVGRRRNAAIRGVGATLRAGALLRKLVSEGLLVTRYAPALVARGTVIEYGLSDKGREQLALANERAERYGESGPRRQTA